MRGAHRFSPGSVDEILEYHTSYGGEVRENIYTALEHLSDIGDEELLVPRPSLEMEPQRLHCEPMREVTYSGEGGKPKHHDRDGREGDHAWYLQGNEVAKGPSVFEGDMVPRYHIVWGSSRWGGN